MTKRYMRSLAELVTKLGMLYRSVDMYRYALLASLLASVITVVLIIACIGIGVSYSNLIHYTFTTLVSLAASDIVSQIFLAMWIINSIEILDQYIKFCRETGKCRRVISEEKTNIMGLVDYPLWFIILYVVSVTFVTSAAYIIMVLVKYGYLDGPLTYTEGVFASNLLYTLGLVLGAIASLVVIVSLLRLGEYVGMETLYVMGVIVSTKYIVDLASLVFSISLIMCSLSTVLTILSLYYAKKISEKLVSIGEYLQSLE